MQKELLVPVYFMPGLAVDSSIFEHISLPEDQFEVHFLEWLIPFSKESLAAYAQRVCKYVKHENVVLIGVSFGGALVQEMSQYISVKRVIIISSVKTKYELPSRMRFSARTGVHKILPLWMLDYVDHFEKIAFNKFLKKRAQLYKKYISVTNKKYLTWAINNMVLWDRETPLEGIVHIHGDLDLVFPYKNIKDCITVKGGTHIMILNRYKWFNRHLPEIILTGNLKQAKKNIKERL